MLLARHLLQQILFGAIEFHGDNKTYIKLRKIWPQSIFEDTVQFQTMAFLSNSGSTTSISSFFNSSSSDGSGSSSNISSSTQIVVVAVVVIVMVISINLDAPEI